MNKRAVGGEQTTRKRDIAYLRKKNDKMEPVFQVER